VQVVEKQLSPTEKVPYVMVHIQALKERAKPAGKGQQQQQQQQQKQGNTARSPQGRSASATSMQVCASFVCQA
jgi:hypothetical protein